MMVMLGAIQTWCIVGFFILLFLFLSFFFFGVVYTRASLLCSMEHPHSVSPGAGPP